MALFDWNWDGKIDMQDNFIEYEVYRRANKNRKQPTGRRYRKGISGAGVFIGMIVGLVMEAMVFMFLGIDIEDVPLIIHLILWIVFSFMIMVGADGIGL